MVRKRNGFLGGMLVGAGVAYAVRRARRRGGNPPAEMVRYGSRLGDIAGLDKATLDLCNSGGSRRASLFRSPVFRIAGGMLLAYGVLRRGRLGVPARTLGMGLLARGAIPRAAQPDRRRLRDGCMRTVSRCARRPKPAPFPIHPSMISA